MLNESASQRFDRVIGTLHDLPGVKSTRPTTVRAIMPLSNEASTHIVQTMRTEDGGFVVFIETMDAQGHVRLVLPDKVAQALYRQRQSLTDRSTPESRARKAARAARERQRQEKAARRAKQQQARA
jgi:hypothetical protein